jgi:hypothetical protein
MALSGFTTAAIPTDTTAIQLSNMAIEEIPQLKIAELKNTPEYRSVSQISYQTPTHDIQHEEGVSIRNGTTGYASNERVVVGPPGGTRAFRTERSLMNHEFQDPTKVGGNVVQQVPNVVERSGFWS